MPALPRRLEATKQTEAAWHTSEERRRVVMAWAHSGMQGWRPTMEDDTVAECLDPSGGTFVFAVFDGHGGDYCSRWAARELPRRLRAAMAAAAAGLSFEHGSGSGSERTPPLAEAPPVDAERSPLQSPGSCHVALGNAAQPARPLHTSTYADVATLRRRPP